MSTPYSNFCDDFYVNLRLGTQLPLPQGRETVLHLFEQLRRSFTDLTQMRRSVRDEEVSLEGDRGEETYRWLAIEPHRLSVGHVNPSTLADSRELAGRVLEIAPYQLGLSPLEVEYVEVLLGFDLECATNHDEVVAEALCGGAPLSCLAEAEVGRPMDFQPRTVVAVGGDPNVQARLEVVTRSDPFDLDAEVRGGGGLEDAISVYVALRRQWDASAGDVTPGTFDGMLETVDALASEHVLERVLRPLAVTIGSGG